MDGIYVEFDNKAIFTFKDPNFNKYNLKDLDVKDVLILILNENNKLIFN